MICGRRWSRWTAGGSRSSSRGSWKSRDGAPLSKSTVRRLRGRWVAEHAQSRAGAAEARDAFGDRHADTHPKAVEILAGDWDRMTAFYDFPAGHWRHLRTTNVVESPFAAAALGAIRSAPCPAGMAAACPPPATMAGLAAPWLPGQQLAGAIPCQNGSPLPGLPAKMAVSPPFPARMAESWRPGCRANPWRTPSPGLARIVHVSHLHPCDGWYWRRRSDVERVNRRTMRNEWTRR